MTVSIEVARQRLVELEAERATLATRHQQQAEAQALAVAGHRESVVLADMAGQPAPAFKPLELPDLPDVAELDERIDALKSAIADAEGQAEISQYYELVDKSERSDPLYRAAQAEVMRLRYEHQLTLKEADHLFHRITRRGHAVTRRPRGLIPAETVSRWLEIGAAGVQAAQAAAEQKGGNHG